MSSDIVKYEDPVEDDGFGGPIKNFRGTSYLSWTAADHWSDRDGMTPPSPLLVMAVGEVLKMWKNGMPTVISTLPLPDPDVLNAEIPESEWELDKNGKPTPPWKHNVRVVLVNAETAETFIYEHYTAGAHIAVDGLREQVMIMRSLRGEKVVAKVMLTERPYSSKKWGKVMRPHFEIIAWVAPGDGGSKAIANQPTPQLSGPGAAAPPPAAPASSKPKNKPSINLGAKDAIDVLTEVEPVTTEELLNDSIPW
jgi:hypothetical protein